MTKILGITTDNASNNNTFLEEVSHELAEKNIELDNVNQHMNFLKQHENMQNINNQVGVVGSIYAKWECLAEIELMLKEAASNAISKLLEYYDKTDTSIYTISLGKYAPIEINIISNEYDSSDEDLITHIPNDNILKNQMSLIYLSKVIIYHWWKRHKAKDYLGIPVTSDRAPETIAIMCLKHWYC
ncbi:hypothetical protein RhiirB3_437481 [Rhizophagus irregularis]|nr:hypothetical protein RhiirB3_437481 [Rhizophagus irregularis]